MRDEYEEIPLFFEQKEKSFLVKALEMNDCLEKLMEDIKSYPMPLLRQGKSFQEKDRDLLIATAVRFG